MKRAIVGDVTETRTFGGPPQFVQHGVFLVGPPTGGFLDWFRHMTLPAVALALGLVGIDSRYVRTAMLVSLGEQYATVARAKGLSERRVVFRHALRNSLVPFTSLLSLEMGGVIGASLAADLFVGVLDPRLRVRLSLGGTPRVAEVDLVVPPTLEGLWGSPDLARSRAR
jgi:binding-protein-dependent transport system inner membrane component